MNLPGIGGSTAVPLQSTLLIIAFLAGALRSKICNGCTYIGFESGVLGIKYSFDSHPSSSEKTEDDRRNESDFGKCRSQHGSNFRSST
jgi:hypothetical protein